MPRARNIKPGLYKNEELAECSIWARYIFPGLWMLADREGRLEDRPKRIKGELLPFDSQDVDPLLRELHQRGFIHRYRNDDGAFIQILKFRAHQTPHYSEKQSVIKPPPFQEIDADIRGPVSEKPPVIKRPSKPPDSLNPDSRTPTPEPSSADTREDSAGGIREKLAGLGVSFKSENRDLPDKWMADGATPALLCKAVEIARETKHAPAPIPAAYLAPIVARLMAGDEPARVNGFGAWWASEDATNAAAAKLGLQAQSGESWDSFRGRIRAAIEFRSQQRAPA